MGRNIPEYSSGTTVVLWYCTIHSTSSTDSTENVVTTLYYCIDQLCKLEQMYADLVHYQLLDFIVVQYVYEVLEFRVKHPRVQRYYCCTQVLYNTVVQTVQKMSLLRRTTVLISDVNSNKCMLIWSTTNYLIL